MLASMRSVAFVALVCILVASPTSALAPHPWRRTRVRPEILRAQMRGESISDRAGPAPPAPPAPPARWIEQPLDHLDTSGVDRRTWRQRYFLNDEWFQRKNAGSDKSNTASDHPLAFLCVGGEGPALTPDVVTTGGVHCALMCQMAKDRGALIVAVEHRFYGASQPTGDLSVESLRYLSSSQALADAANLIASLNAEYGGSAMRWVSFGGSYPGMMASWLRLKYPHLVHAAVASSAPIQAELEMRGYDEVVGAALAETDVGGSDACVASVTKAFSAVSDMLGTPAGRSRLAKTFGVCKIQTEIPNVNPLQFVPNRAEFVAALTEVFPAQSNDPSCKTFGCDIRSVCAVMTGVDPAVAPGSSELDRLVQLTKNAFGGECVDVDHESNVQALGNTSLEPGWEKGDGDFERSWFWQTCTEFGFYQTCVDGSKCPFIVSPNLQTLEFNTAVCGRVFGNMSVSEVVTGAAARSNVLYGGWSPGSTRVLFPSGTVDPWRANSLTDEREFSPEWLPTMMVAGASHHAWTHPPRDTDQDSVKRARIAIAAQVDEWLGEGPMAARVATEQNTATEQNIATER